MDNRFLTLLNLKYQLWLSLKANRKDQEGLAVIKITVFPTEKLLSHSDKLGLKIAEHFAGETPIWLLQTVLTLQDKKAQTWNLPALIRKWNLHSPSSVFLTLKEFIHNNRA